MYRNEQSFPRRCMPAKGKSKVSETQKRKIAAGKALGKPSAAIAADAGVSISTVDHHAQKPHTQALIRKLKDRHSEELEKLFSAALKGIKTDLASAHGDIRVRTRAQVLKFITAGDPRTDQLPAGGAEGQYTFEELLVTYRRATSRSEENS